MKEKPVAHQEKLPLFPSDNKPTHPEILVQQPLDLFPATTTAQKNGDHRPTREVLRDENETTAGEEQGYR